MVDKLLEFFKLANNLKWTERSGWVAKVNVKEPESVADHCYLMALMCMVIAELKGLDSSKAVKMALLHDIAESLTGDYMPDDVTLKEKIEEETKAIKSILNKLPAKLRTNYAKLWQEYKMKSSKEAVLVHQIDKLEMALQANDYLKKGYSMALLRQFFESAGSGIKDRSLLGMLNSLKNTKS